MTTSGKTARWLPLLLAAMFLLGGCAGWRPVREVEIDPPPEQFSRALPDSVVLADTSRWWHSFDDPTLNALIDSAFSSNLSFAQMLARHEQARRQLYMARASWFPTINGSANYQRQGYVEEQESAAGFTGSTGGGGEGGSGGGFNPSSLFVLEEQFTVGLNAAWELDLFGKNHATRQAAAATFHASEEDLRAYMLSLSALVARSWYTAVMLHETEVLLDTTLDAYQKNTDLIDMRFQRGVAQSTDLYQARTSLEATRADAEANRARLAGAEHALSTLLGDYPHRGWVEDSDRLPSEIPPLDSGVPATLIQQRPDVRAAYARMVAADRQAAAAVAGMFPSLTLTGGLSGFSTERIGDAVDPANLFWSAGASLSAPIFQGGRLWNQKEAAHAGWLAAAAGYRQTVLTAFREVEDALANNHHLQRALQHRRAQAEAAQSNLRVAWDRYLRGVTGFVPMTIAETNFLNARRGLAQARYNLIDARIALATALGGGWMDDVLASVDLDDDTATISKDSDE